MRERARNAMGRLFRFGRGRSGNEQRAAASRSGGRASGS
jgi:hypothetical protein